MRRWIWSGIEGKCWRLFLICMRKSASFWKAKGNIPTSYKARWRCEMINRELSQRAACGRRRCSKSALSVWTNTNKPVSTVNNVNKIMYPTWICFLFALLPTCGQSCLRHVDPVWPSTQVSFWKLTSCLTWNVPIIEWHTKYFALRLSVIVIHNCCSLTYYYYLARIIM